MILHDLRRQNKEKTAVQSGQRARPFNLKHNRCLCLIIILFLDLLITALLGTADYFPDSLQPPSKESLFWDVRRGYNWKV